MTLSFETLLDWLLEIDVTFDLAIVVSLIIAFITWHLTKKVT